MTFSFLSLFSHRKNNNYFNTFNNFFNIFNNFFNI